MPDRELFIYDATNTILRNAVYFAYEKGELSDEEYVDAIKSLRGLPRNATCPGRVFHNDPQHVCPDNVQVHTGHPRVWPNYIDNPDG